MGKHAILIVKNDKEELLNDYNESWESYLFPNCKLPEEENEELYYDIIIEYLNKKCNIDAFTVDNIGYKKHKKFSEKDKIEKEYEHYFYIVKPFKEVELKDGFKWFTIKDLENNERIMKVNKDIVDIVKELKY